MSEMENNNAKERLKRINRRRATKGAPEGALEAGGFDVDSISRSKTMSGRLLRQLGLGEPDAPTTDSTDSAISVSSDDITSLSNSLTSLQTIFNSILANQKNIKNVQKAVTDGATAESKEKTLENISPIVGPNVTSTGGDITLLLPQLTQALEQLGKSLEQLDLTPTTTQQQGPFNDQGIGGGGKLGRAVKIGAGVAAAAGGAYLAYSMFGGDSSSEDSVKDATPTPSDRQEPLGSAEFAESISPQTPVPSGAQEPLGSPEFAESVSPPEIISPQTPPAVPVPVPSDSVDIEPESGGEDTQARAAQSQAAAQQRNLDKERKKTEQTTVKVAEKGVDKVIRGDASKEEVTRIAVSGQSFTDSVTSQIKSLMDIAGTRSGAAPSLGGGGGGGGGDSGDYGDEQGSPGSFTAGAGMKGLLDLIASGEGSYNSMNQGGADQGSIRGSTHNASKILGKNLPEMTVGEVKRYQALPRNDSKRLFAAGRYQIIPSTMRAVTKSAGVKDNQLFDVNTQDKLGAQLVLNRKPAKDYIQGKTNNPEHAIVSLAKEWASLPNLTDRSFYPPYRKTPHTARQVKAALDAARTNKPVTISGGSFGGRGVVGGITGLGGERIGDATTMDGTKISGGGTFLHPTKNVRITSRFGPRNTGIPGASTNHKGIDYGPQKPGTQGDPIYASATGTVSFAGSAGGYGNVIYVGHANGYETRYAHLKKMFVRSGQSVIKGQQIAQLGNTGIGSGPHLHFEIRKSGTAINPLSMLSGGTVQPDPTATEPSNEDSGRNPSAKVDKGPAKPLAKSSPKVGQAATDVAIQKRTQELRQGSSPTVVVISANQPSGPGPAEYLTGIAGVKKPSTPQATSRNSALEYKYYFNAA